MKGNCYTPLIPSTSLCCNMPLSLELSVEIHVIVVFCFSFIDFLLFSDDTGKIQFWRESLELKIKANCNVSGLWSVWWAQLLRVLLITGQLGPTCKANASLSLTKPLPASLWCISCIALCPLQEVYVLQPRPLSPKQPIPVCSVSQLSVVSVAALRGQHLHRSVCKACVMCSSSWCEMRIKCFAALQVLFGYNIASVCAIKI